MFTYLNTFNGLNVFELESHQTSTHSHDMMIEDAAPHWFALQDFVAALALGFFVALFIFRYLRCVVGIWTWWTFKPKPISEKPLYKSSDVTVVVPTTFKAPGELVKCLKGIMSCSPAAVFVVTSHPNVELVKTCCALHSFRDIKVLGVDKLNKRVQMRKALKEIETEITVFADDDVVWPSFKYLDYLLAIFEDPEVGAGGTRQRVSRRSGNFWNFLGICYLERRVWNNISTNAIDGSISTLSGRTAAYRTEILKNDDFFHYFTHDSWRGRPLNSDDDKCLTRYVYKNGWRIAIQSDPNAIIETTLEEDSKYISQCLRWARAHWRGNLIVMENESYWRSWKYCWGLYVIYWGQFQTPALLVDGSLFALLYLALIESRPEHRILAFSLLGSWIFFTKIMKLIPHFIRHPGDLKFIPISIAFSYLHGMINVYAAYTLTHTHWGSQNLEALQAARATDAEVVPLLRHAVHEAEEYHEPTYVYVS